MKYRRLFSNIFVSSMKLDVLMVRAIALFYMPTFTCKNPFPNDRTIDLIAVTRFEDIENFYKSQRTSRILPRPLTLEEKTDRYTRRNLCERIFSSNYFIMNGEEWIDVDDRKFKESLKITNPDFFEVVYRFTMNPFARFFGNDGSKYVFREGYKDIKVSIGNVERLDYGFKCLVRERQTNQIKQYFVSRAYNVNTMKLLPPIGARFILLLDQENDKLTVHALADTPVYLRKLNDVEWFYKQTREKYPYMPSETPENDPICSLTPSNKLRLCAVVLSSAELRKMVKFTPSLENVDLSCEKRIVAFQSDWAREIAVTRIFEEWTMGCTASSIINHDEQVTYYVSRTYSYNNLFVYKLMDARLFIIHFAEKAGMVADVEEMLHYIGFYTRHIPPQSSRQTALTSEEVRNEVSELKLSDLQINPSSSNEVAVPGKEEECCNESLKEIELQSKSEDTNVREMERIETNLPIAAPLETSFAQGSGCNDGNGLQFDGRSLIDLSLRDVEASSSKPKTVKKVTFKPNLTTDILR